MSSIEDVQSALDELMLSVFEAARVTDANGGVEAAKASIMAKYEATLAAVDTLDGIDVTEEEQLATIRQLSEEYEAARLLVLQMRDKVQALEGQAAVQLRAMLKVAGLERTEED